MRVNYILILLISISASIAQQIYPECQTEEQFATMWPDFEDPTRYFLCTGLGSF
ncbi:hypothetical protein Bhyg_06482, partial [Pseudolycoriella hygida]